MKIVKIFLFMVTITFGSYAIISEVVHRGNYTNPDVYTPDLIIIDGNLDLKDTFTVEGDLKIINGGVQLISDNSSASTVDLYIGGDLVVTNTNVTGNLSAPIYIPTGRLFVSGEIFTNSKNLDAFVDVKYGISAGAITTYAGRDAHITCSEGLINVDGNIVTRGGRRGDIIVGKGDNTLTVSPDLYAGGVYTYANPGGPGNGASIFVDGSIFVQGEIVTRSDDGNASISAVQYYDGKLVAHTIITNAYASGVIDLAGSANGSIDVVGDIVTTSSKGSAYVYTAGGFIKAENISTEAESDAYVLVEGGNIDVIGDIKTASLGRGASSADAYVGVADGYLKARSITTSAGNDAKVGADSYISVQEEIVTHSRFGNASGSAIVFSGESLDAGRIVTDSDLWDAYVYAPGNINVRGTISTRSDTNDAKVESDADLYAGSIFTYSPDDNGYVSASVGEIKVEDIISTNANDGHLLAANDICARSITTTGASEVYVYSSNGSIDVIEDIETYSFGAAAAYVIAPNGTIRAQKIRTESAGGVATNARIEGAAGTAFFEFVPTDGSSMIIKNAEFSLDRDHDWNVALEIQGTCTIDGSMHQLTFISGGEISVANGATLYLKNIKLEELYGEAVKCLGTGEIKIYDVTWSQSGDCQFKNGSIDVVKNFWVEGPGTVFSYESSTNSVVRSGGAWMFSRGMTFEYNRSGDEGIYFQGARPRFGFDGARLLATRSIDVSGATLVLDNEVTFSADSSMTIIVPSNSMDYERRVGSIIKFDGLGTITN